MNDKHATPTPWVRYDVILPAFFNDKSKVPPKLFKQTFDEVLEQFGALTLGNGPFRGSWKDENGKVFDDENYRFYVDCKDTESNLAWFRSHKEPWKLRFKQHDLWITSHPIRLI
jgi:hypothetical protein